ncbi:MAG: hypothetical protein JO170_28395 [Verrucomicrobia bacterium]|nr:hypothetical protein [Verrucomicrobiota bacterium]
MKKFLAAGVRHFIDLTEAGELEPYAETLREEAGSEMSYKRIPIRDVSVPENPETMAAIIAAIDRAMADEGITYVRWNIPVIISSLPTQIGIADLAD